MPNTREKLIEILRGAINTHTEKKEQWILGGKVGEEPRLFGSFADHLIANGVTIQRWIPVTERLPENDTHILVTTYGVAVSAYWHNDRFYAFTANGVASVGGVTHWMPLPTPPKGE